MTSSHVYSRTYLGWMEPDAAPPQPWFTPAEVWVLLILGVSLVAWLVPRC